MAQFPVEKTDAEWRAQLNPEAFEVLRRAATERPFTGDLLNVTDDGVYTCAGCGTELFTSTQKFDSHCGWPSFDDEAGEIIKVEDRSLGMVRTEILCAACGGHLGHLFNDGPTSTGLRYCVNSLSLAFEPAEEA